MTKVHQSKPWLTFLQAARSRFQDTALRFYVDDVTTFVRTMPPLCVTDPGFEWGSTAYMPFNPMYGILNVAVKQNTVASTWWDTHNATTLVDWVRMYTLVDG